MSAEKTPLAQIVEVSRRLGADPSLVLHGGGNTSIKGTSTDVTGALVDTVWVKGSGWDLATIEAAGFTPLRRHRLLEVLEVHELTDEQMVNEIRQASLRADAPTASIEALLHAMLPARVVLHSHADAIVALTDQVRPRTEALGDGVLVLPYVMPGFVLAKTVAAALAADTGASGRAIDAIVLSNHGLFTFADDAEAAYERHVSLVARATETTALEADEAPAAERTGDIIEISALRTEISRVAGAPMILTQSTSARGAAWAKRPDVRALTTRGTATPEHLIRTKRHPLIGRDVNAFAEEAHAYFAAHRGERTDLSELDPAPRVILDPQWGLLTAGESVVDAGIAFDVYEHTMRIVDAADAMTGYESLDVADSFDIEYWSLEQAKLHRRARPEFGGEIAVVTGAASGIGRAAAARLLAGGAAVVGIDLNPGVVDTFDSERWRGVVGDVSNDDILASAAEVAVRDFGGVDILVVAAGVFPASASLAENDARGWNLAMTVNATAVARAFVAFHPFLSLAPRGGRVVLVSTKNVAAPGPGVSAYSASKAAAAQLARVAAMEWASDGIRVNSVEPDAVFDTGIWTDELLHARAANYGMTVDEYKTRNLLGVDVNSSMVADAVALFAGLQLPATTGAHLSVDGGNNRVI